MFTTSSQVTRHTFGVERSNRMSIHYSHTDVAEGDMWLVDCADCDGNGYDIEAEGFSCCEACDGLGQYGPMSESETRSFVGL